MRPGTPQVVSKPQCPPCPRGGGSQPRLCLVPCPGFGAPWVTRQFWWRWGLRRCDVVSHLFRQVLLDGHLSLHGFAQDIGRGRAATSLLGGVSQGALLPVSLHPIPPEPADLEPQGGRPPAGPSHAGGGGPMSQSPGAAGTAHPLPPGKARRLCLRRAPSPCFSAGIYITRTICICQPWVRSRSHPPATCSRR